MVDRVEHHVEQAQDYAAVAKKELYQANVYASKARKVRYNNKIFNFSLSLSLLLPLTKSTGHFEIINMNSCAHVVIHFLGGGLIMEFQRAKLTSRAKKKKCRLVGWN
jgi:hypothetical protein